MENRKAKRSGAPKFTNERDESKWWASAAGRTFLTRQSLVRTAEPGFGSKLVARLAHANSEKMFVHEGLERVENQR